MADELFFCIEAIWQVDGGEWTVPVENVRVDGDSNLHVLIADTWRDWVAAIDRDYGQAAAALAIFRATPITGEEYDPN